MKSKRQAVRETQQKQQQIARGIAIAFIAVLFIIIGYFIYSSATAPAKPIPTIPAQSTEVDAADMLGTAVPVSGANDHIEEGSDPGEYSTNPPTSGHHYPTWLEAGFVETNTRKYPQGNLVHNLEHGHVIFWYNCKILTDTQCADLKTQLKAVIEATGNFKVIAYPWETIDVPVVATSWGYMLPFKTFDAQTARTFVDQHRNRAPEPNAP